MKNKHIVILYDYTNRKCRSYMDVKEDIKNNKDVIFTNCLSFFSQTYYHTHGYDVIVLKKDCSKIIMSELLSNKHEYTAKWIRREHNLYKMLLAGAFMFKKHELDLSNIINYINDIRDHVSTIKNGGM